MLVVLGLALVVVGFDVVLGLVLVVVAFVEEGVVVVVIGFLEGTLTSTGLGATVVLDSIVDSSMANVLEVVIDDGAVD